MQRLFVAISLPEVVVDALGQLQSGLDGARWRDSDQLHLTLQFIGEVSRRQADDVAVALSGLSVPAFPISLKGCGSFGGDYPRAVWAGVGANDGLGLLQSKVTGALKSAGVEITHRKYAPHVTLAYVEGLQQDAVEKFCAVHGLFKCGPFTIREFHLYESFLGGDGSHYEILETFPLAGAGA
ncbi:MAG: RNA 2',3'-cyclic phosphodiesterase [Pseudomonadota bacterium]